VSAAERFECLALVREAHGAGARKELACELIGVDPRTVARWETRPEDLRQGPNATPSNALTEEEQAAVLKVANSPEYANLPPGQIVPRLADLGIYLASESTFYRLFKANDLLAHRSKSHPHQHKKPESLLATSPNQIWSWDITYLRAEVRGQFYYLYLPMDIFSRLIVHWEIHETETAELAGEMITRACEKQGIKRGQIKLHSDNGGPMKGATMLATLEWLGIAASRSRPRVSDDNPFSESLFKTLKYCPSFPLGGRFLSIDAAKTWVEAFVHWYNNIHLHSGINWVTPASRHANQDQCILTNRTAVYEAAREKNPNRWSENVRDWSRPNIVELNPGRSPKINKINDCQSAS
jgi:transposase InsO family protein